MLQLQVLQGPDRGKVYELPEGEPQLIGRSSEALPVTDTTVSRRHAELTPDDGGVWRFRDLDSANGSFINGRRITGDSQAITPGDQIRCGSTLFLVKLAGDDERRQAVDVLEDGMDVTVHGRVDARRTSQLIAGADPLRVASEHLRVIYKLTAVTVGAFSREQLYERVMDLIFQEFSPDRGFILLGSDPHGPMDAAIVRYRQRPANVDEGRIPVSRTIIEHTLSANEGTLSTNAMNDERFASGDSVRDYGIRSAICVPMAAGRRTFGVIHIDSQEPDFAFTEAQLHLLTAIGQHAGLVLLSTERMHTHVQTERLAAIGQTVASLSHSIKNILQGLRGGADAVELALNREDVELARQGWPILTRNLDRILALSMNMLAYSRGSAPDIELADLNAIAVEAAELIQRECDRRRVALVRDLADDIPPVPLDINGAHQALMNVLNNAVEAAPAKRGVVTLSSAFDADGHRAILTVADNGPGLDEAVEPFVFEAFTSTKGQRGTGLGLAVTRKLIEEQGGEVELESNPGRGVTVRLILPTDRADLDAGDTRLPPPAPDRPDAPQA